MNNNDVKLVLQVFLPLNWLRDLFAPPNTGFPENLDGLPALHTNNAFLKTLKVVLEDEQLETKLSDGLNADVFGVTALQLLSSVFEDTTKRAKYAIACINRFDLIAGQQNEVAIRGDFTLDEVRKHEFAVAEATFKNIVTGAQIDDFNEGGATKTALRKIVGDLVSNANRYPRGKVATYRTRYSYQSHNDKFGCPFAELSFATASTRFSDSISSSSEHNSLDVASRLALSHLNNEVEKDREALYFALLPGFSTSASPKAISKPENESSNGLAIFYLSQLARVSGSMAILSGRSFLRIGKQRSYFRNDVLTWQWDADTKVEPSDVAVFRGTLFGIQLRSDMLELNDGIRAISLICAQKFWESERLLLHFDTLATLYNREGLLRFPLMYLYNRYLAFEAKLLDNSFKDIEGEIKKLGTYPEKSLQEIRSRLLNAGPKNKPLPDEFKKLPRSTEGFEPIV